MCVCVDFSFSVLWKNFFFFYKLSFSNSFFFPKGHSEHGGSLFSTVILNRFHPEYDCRVSITQARYKSNYTRDINLHTRVCVCACVLAYTHTHTHTHTHTCVCIYVYILSSYGKFRFFFFFNKQTTTHPSGRQECIQ